MAEEDPTFLAEVVNQHLSTAKLVRLCVNNSSSIQIS